jgi:hypothetical protein
LGCDGLPGHEALAWLLGGEEATPMAEPAPLTYAAADPAAYDAFEMPVAAEPLPEITAPPRPLAEADAIAWEDDDIPSPTGEALPDLGLPEQLPPEDERAQLLSRLSQGEEDAADAPERDTS